MLMCMCAFLHINLYNYMVVEIGIGIVGDPSCLWGITPAPILSLHMTLALLSWANTYY